MASITLPHNFTPRDYQLPFLRAMDSGIKRSLIVWHRRSGKDKTSLNLVTKKAFERVGPYFYLFPTYAQGKKVIWDGIDGEGKPFLDCIPKQVITSKNETELKIDLINKSYIQIIGTDNINSIVGTNPAGCIFSEYALQSPLAWDYLRPILLENGGWAAFNLTPRGHNHGFDLYNMAKSNPDWFVQLLTVNDTKRPDGSPVISEADIESERREGMDEDLIQQEYFCSFEGSIQGNYYGRWIRAAEDQGRICRVPYDPRLPVTTFWDLGIGDSMAIWFMQQLRQEYRMIDYLESSGEGLQFYVQELQKKGYIYAEHVLPHDAEVRELGTGKSRRDVALTLGLRPIRICPNLTLDDGIAAARLILPLCWFDAEKCKPGLNALRDYHKEYDEKRQEFKQKPFHDWSSHAADAFRYFAVGCRQEVIESDDDYYENNVAKGRSSVTGY